MNRLFVLALWGCTGTLGPQGPTPPAGVCWEDGPAPAFPADWSQLGAGCWASGQCANGVRTASEAGPGDCGQGLTGYFDVGGQRIGLREDADSPRFCDGSDPERWWGEVEACEAPVQRALSAGCLDPLPVATDPNCRRETEVPLATGASRLDEAEAQGSTQCLGTSACVWDGRSAVAVLVPDGCRGHLADLYEASTGAWIGSVELRPEPVDGCTTGARWYQAVFPECVTGPWTPSPACGTAGG